MPEPQTGLASIRIFSNAPGDYGSGVPDAALDSTNWEDDAIIAQTYLASQSFAYGTSDWGQSVASFGLFEKQLKGVDAAILARSSNVHGVLSTDHPFEYLGGFVCGREIRQRRKPGALYFRFAARQAENGSGKQVLSQDELRARYQNPQWISAMMV